MCEMYNKYLNLNNEKHDLFIVVGPQIEVLFDGSIENDKGRISSLFLEISPSLNSIKKELSMFFFSHATQFEINHDIFIWLNTCIILRYTKIN